MGCRVTWETRTGTRWSAWRGHTYSTWCLVVGTGSCVSGGETTVIATHLTALLAVRNAYDSTMATATLRYLRIDSQPKTMVSHNLLLGLITIYNMMLVFHQRYG